jgi:hypothetical protein
METRISQLHTEDAKEREIRKYTKTESQHLRLRRTKIKLSDFRTVKVIGKGAFGEVCSLYAHNCFESLHPFNVGSFGTKGGHWEGICHEKFTKGGDVEPRSGQNSPSIKVPLLISFHSLLMSEQNVTFLLNQHLPGLCSCFILSRILSTSILSWSFYPAGI